MPTINASLLLLLIFFLGFASNSFHARQWWPNYQNKLLTAPGVEKIGVLDPTQLKCLSWNPRVFLRAGFLSDQECDHLISLAKGRLMVSMVEDEVTGNAIQAQERTSTGMFLRLAQDEIVSRIEERIASWAFLPSENGEFMQILRYEHGQKYEPHVDYLIDERHRIRGGHRVATVLMYLSDVEKGGETVFPHAKAGLTQPKDESWSDCAMRDYAVKPRKGDAVLFYNLHLNATTDPLSLHGSCPVLQGEKWSATKWIREGSFSGPR